MQLFKGTEKGQGANCYDETKKDFDSRGFRVNIGILINLLMIETAAKVSHNEVIKEANPTLAGTVGATLADPALDRFSEDDAQFLKFHGIYQQDDRDKRKVAKEYMVMVRGRLPGRVVPADQ